MQFAILFFLKIRFIKFISPPFFATLRRKDCPFSARGKKLDMTGYGFPRHVDVQLARLPPKKEGNKLNAKRNHQNLYKRNDHSSGGRMWRSEKQGKDLFMPCRPATKYNSIIFVSHKDSNNLRQRLTLPNVGTSSWLFGNLASSEQTSEMLTYQTVRFQLPKVHFFLCFICFFQDLNLGFFPCQMLSTAHLGKCE